MSDKPKLYNVIIAYDIWIVAESREAAMAGAKAVIADGGESPNEQYAYELTKARDIPARMQGSLPYLTAPVAEAVEDGKIPLDLDNDDVHRTFEKLTAP